MATPADVLGGKKKKKKPKPKAPRHKETRIEHHADGSHTIRHTPAGGGEEISYAAPDLAGVHEGLNRNLGADTQDQSPLASLAERLGNRSAPTPS